jgi:hypothetical protein
MCQELLTGGRVRLVCALAEEDIAASGEGQGTHVPVQRVGLPVGVDAHVREAGGKGLLHRHAGCRIEPRTTGACCVDARRHTRRQRATLCTNGMVRLVTADVYVASGPLGTSLHHASGYL